MSPDEAAAVRVILAERNALRAQVTAVEGLLAFLAKISPSPRMTVEVQHVQAALDTGHVPDLTAGKKIGQTEGASRG